MSDRAKELADELREDGVFVDAADELDRLRADLSQRTAERDKARREACELLARSMKGPMEIAADRGWDCFAPHANTTDVPVQNGGE
jgi:hypothetical protein